MALDKIGHGPLREKHPKDWTDEDFKDAKTADLLSVIAEIEQEADKRGELDDELTSIYDRVAAQYVEKARREILSSVNKPSDHQFMNLQGFLDDLDKKGRDKLPLLAEQEHRMKEVLELSDQDYLFPASPSLGTLGQMIEEKLFEDMPRNQLTLAEAGVEELYGKHPDEWEDKVLETMDLGDLRHTLSHLDGIRRTSQNDDEVGKIFDRVGSIYFTRLDNEQGLVQPHDFGHFIIADEIFRSIHDWDQFPELKTQKNAIQQLAEIGKKINLEFNMADLREKFGSSRLPEGTTMSIGPGIITAHVPTRSKPITRVFAESGEGNLKDVHPNHWTEEHFKEASTEDMSQTLRNLFAHREELEENPGPLDDLGAAYIDRIHNIIEDNRFSDDDKIERAYWDLTNLLVKRKELPGLPKLIDREEKLRNALKVATEKKRAP